MKKTLTYTPTNLRKNLFKACQEASDNKVNIRITIKPKNNGVNKNLIMLDENKATKWENAYKILKKQKLLGQIAHETAGLSSHPTFTNPKEFEKWSEKIGD